MYDPLAAQRAQGQIHQPMSNPVEHWYAREVTVIQTLIAHIYSVRSLIQTMPDVGGIIQTIEYFARVLFFYQERLLMAMVGSKTG